MLHIESDAVLSGASTPPAASLDSQFMWSKPTKGSNHKDAKQKEATINPFYAAYNHHSRVTDRKNYEVMFSQDRSSYIEADLVVKGDRHLASIAIGSFPDLFVHAPHRIKNDVEIAARAVRALPQNVAFVGDEVKSNPAFWEAVAHNTGESRH